ncbi:MAG: ABC transporter permease [Candidatus Omnitrophica bacterium]|nr:ABC transporter permease [Candidatus Omnitrophota bacterium]MCB9747586.1 ABC transporter permease [Candidatus Omnitrophota bacterium]
MIHVIGYSGSLILKLIQYLGEIGLLFARTIYLALIPPFKVNRLLTQAKRVGPGSFFIAALIAFFVGMIIAVQMAYQMVKLSAEIYIPNVVSVSLTRELAPVLTALIVAGRIGAGITAEIGSMAVTEQVDALKAFAVNPVKFLVVPRFLALVVMLPLLTIFADIIGIVGGYVICVYKLLISPELYFNMVAEALTAKDILTGLFKTIFFGAIIALVGCHQGLNVKGGAEGVGQSTTRSVVISFILIIMTNALFTTLFYFIFRM